MQVDLATAMLGDLSASLVPIQSAIEGYRKQQDLDYLDVEKYVHQARRAEAMVYEALMLKRTGDL